MSKRDISLSKNSVGLFLVSVVLAVIILGFYFVSLYFPLVMPSPRVGIILVAFTLVLLIISAVVSLVMFLSSMEKLGPRKCSCGSDVPAKEICCGDCGVYYYPRQEHCGWCGKVLKKDLGHCSSCASKIEKNGYSITATMPAGSRKG